MGGRGAAATLALHLMLVATLALAAATFMSMAEAECSGGSMSMAQEVSSRSGRFRVPEGGEDGLYEGSVEVDEQGVEQYRVTFLGKGNTTLDSYGRWANNNVSRAATGGLGRKLLQVDTGPHCDGSFMDPSEILMAFTGLASLIESAGAKIPARRTRYYILGCTVAYVCNFNNGDLSVTSSTISADNFSLHQACTVYGGGWYAHETSNSRDGRTHIFKDFC